MLRRLLDSGIESLQLDISEESRERLIDYIDLLSKWNQVYNLTSVRNPNEMVGRHLLDSLAIVPYITGHRIIDVGTGAGLPGIPLAIFFPEKFFTLLDSNSKKTRFLIQAKHELKLDNVEVVNARVEDYNPAHCFDQVLSRAFTKINDMLEMTQHLLCKDGQFLAMKGVYPEQELGELRNEFSISNIEPIKVPGVEGDRHVVIIQFAKT